MSPRTKSRIGFVAQAAGALGLLTVIALMVDGDSVSAPEESVFRAINSLPDLIYAPLWVLMQAGNLLAAPVAGIVAFAFKRFRLGALLIAVAVLKYFSARIIKDLVTRHRPASLLEDIQLRHAPRVGLAFVSGHAAIAVGLAAILAAYFKGPFRWVALVVAATVCFARVYVGAHLPLDVIGGAALGWAIGTLLLAIAPPKHPPSGPPGPRTPDRPVAT